jgi:hypothetical protein
VQPRAKACVTQFSIAHSVMKMTGIHPLFDFLIRAQLNADAAKAKSALKEYST